ncbi:hypothetical protein B0T18DRAFT_324512 [Schizothecium vesticola]|uniref:Uncharacterized protein n=1 Tax=Schizothecium vesticola TaxID=314040 RepID=A0AA40K4T3_9PEZI|nr:hypothetical protein B0T18DRAFT_324512 [Schizothecium vesticola]
MLPLTLTLLLLPLLTLAAPSRKYPRFTVPQSHFEVLSMRQSTPLNPRAITDTTCIDRNTHIVFHEQNAAELAICDGLPGGRCRTGAREATGRAGSAVFVLRAVEAGASVTVTKARWEGCVRAARAVCPTGSLRSVCLGGASSGDVEFWLGGP